MDQSPGGADSPKSPRATSVFGSAFAVVRNYFTPERVAKNARNLPSPIPADHEPSSELNLSALGRHFAALNLDEVNDSNDSNESFRTTVSRTEDSFKSTVSTLEAPDSSFGGGDTKVHGEETEATVILDETVVGNSVLNSTPNVSFKKGADTSTPVIVISDDDDDVELLPVSRVKNELPIQFLNEPYSLAGPTTPDSGLPSENHSNAGSPELGKAFVSSSSENVLPLNNVSHEASSNYQDSNKTMSVDEGEKDVEQKVAADFDTPDDFESTEKQNLNEFLVDAQLGLVESKHVSSEQVATSSSTSDTSAPLLSSEDILASFAIGDVNLPEAASLLLSNEDKNMLEMIIAQIPKEELASLVPENIELNFSSGEALPDDNMVAVASASVMNDSVVVSQEKATADFGAKEFRDLEIQAENNSQPEIKSVGIEVTDESSENVNSTSSVDLKSDQAQNGGVEVSEKLAPPLTKVIWVDADDEISLAIPEGLNYSSVNDSLVDSSSADLAQSLVSDQTMNESKTGDLSTIPEVEDDGNTNISFEEGFNKKGDLNELAEYSLTTSGCSESKGVVANQNVGNEADLNGNPAGNFESDAQTSGVEVQENPKSLELTGFEIRNPGPLSKYRTSSDFQNSTLDDISVFGNDSMTLNESKMTANLSNTEIELYGYIQGKNEAVTSVADIDDLLSAISGGLVFGDSTLQEPSIIENSLLSEDKSAEAEEIEKSSQFEITGDLSIAGNEVVAQVSSSPKAPRSEVENLSATGYCAVGDGESSSPNLKNVSSSSGNIFLQALENNTSIPISGNTSSLIASETLGETTELNNSVKIDGDKPSELFNSKAIEVGASMSMNVTAASIEQLSNVNAAEATSLNTTASIPELSTDIPPVIHSSLESLPKAIDSEIILLDSPSPPIDASLNETDQLDDASNIFTIESSDAVGNETSQDNPQAIDLLSAPVQTLPIESLEEPQNETQCLVNADEALKEDGFLSTVLPAVDGISMESPPQAIDSEIIPLSAPAQTQPIESLEEPGDEKECSVNTDEALKEECVGYLCTILPALDGISLESTPQAIDSAIIPLSTPAQSLPIDSLEDPQNIAGDSINGESISSDSEIISSDDNDYSPLIENLEANRFDNAEDSLNCNLSTIIEILNESCFESPLQSNDSEIIPVAVSPQSLPIETTQNGMELLGNVAGTLRNLCDDMPAGNEASCESPPQPDSENLTLLATTPPIESLETSKNGAELLDTSNVEPVLNMSAGVSAGNEALFESPLKPDSENPTWLATTPPIESLETSQNGAEILDTSNVLPVINMSAGVSAGNEASCESPPKPDSENPTLLATTPPIESLETSQNGMEILDKVTGTLNVESVRDVDMPGENEASCKSPSTPIDSENQSLLNTTTPIESSQNKTVHLDIADDALIVVPISEISLMSPSPVIESEVVSSDVSVLELQQESIPFENTPDLSELVNVSFQVQKNLQQTSENETELSSADTLEVEALTKPSLESIVPSMKNEVSTENKINETELKYANAVEVETLMKRSLENIILSMENEISAANEINKIARNFADGLEVEALVKPSLENSVLSMGNVTSAVNEISETERDSADTLESIGLSIENEVSTENKINETSRNSLDVEALMKPSLENSVLSMGNETSAANEISETELNSAEALEVEASLENSVLLMKNETSPDNEIIPINVSTASDCFELPGANESVAVNKLDDTAFQLDTVSIEKLNVVPLSNDTKAMALVCDDVSSPALLAPEGETDLLGANESVAVDKLNDTAFQLDTVSFDIVPLPNNNEASDNLSLPALPEPEGQIDVNHSVAMDSQSSENTPPPAVSAFGKDGTVSPVAGNSSVVDEKAADVQTIASATPAKADLPSHSVAPTVYEESPIKALEKPSLLQLNNSTTLTVSNASPVSIESQVAVETIASFLPEEVANSLTLSENTLSPASEKMEIDVISFEAGNNSTTSPKLVSQSVENETAIVEVITLNDTFDTQSPSDQRQLSHEDSINITDVKPLSMSHNFDIETADLDLAPLDRLFMMKQISSSESLSPLLNVNPVAELKELSLEDINTTDVNQLSLSNNFNYDTVDLHLGPNESQIHFEELTSFSGASSTSPKDEGATPVLQLKVNEPLECDMSPVGSVSKSSCNATPNLNTTVTRAKYSTPIEAALNETVNLDLTTPLLPLDETFVTAQDLDGDRNRRIALTDLEETMILDSVMLAINELNRSVVEVDNINSTVEKIIEEPKKKKSQVPTTDYEAVNAENSLQFSNLLGTVGLQNNNKTMLNTSARAFSGILKEITDNIVESPEEKIMGSYMSKKQGKPAEQLETVIGESPLKRLDCTQSEVLESFNTDFQPSDFELFNKSFSESNIGNVPRESLYLKFDPFYQPRRNLDNTIFVGALKDGGNVSELLPNVSVVAPIPSPVKASALNKEIALREEIARLKELYLQRLDVEEERVKKSQQRKDELDKQFAELQEKLLTWKEKETNLLISLKTVKDSNEDMSALISEYESTIEKATAQAQLQRTDCQEAYSALKKDRDSYNQHLKSADSAFIDVSSKYEKIRSIVTELKATQAALEREANDLRRAAVKLDDRLRSVQEETTEVTAELEEIASKQMAMQADESARLSAQLRKAEFTVGHLQETLDKKTTENVKLANICDDLIGGKVLM